MSRTLKIGDIVKFCDKFTTVTGYTAIDGAICAILETTDGLTGAVPVRDVRWDGKKFLCLHSPPRRDEGKAPVGHKKMASDYPNSQIRLIFVTPDGRTFGEDIWAYEVLQQEVLEVE